MSCLLEILQSPFGVEREMELIAPAELKTCLRQSIVAYGSTGVSLCQIGCVGGYLIGNDSCTYIFLIRQRKVLLRSYIAQHGGAKPSYLRSTNGTGNMVVAGSNIGNNRTKCVERSLVALVELALHILTYLMHGYMTRTFDECLHILVPSSEHKLAHSVELCKLSCIVGIGSTSGAQTVAKTQGHIVAGNDIAYIIKMLVKETLLVVYQAPLAHNATATANDATQSAIGQVNVVATYAGMDGEIVNTLLALLYQCVAIYLPRKVFNLSINLFQSLIDGHSAYGYRTVTQNPLAGFVDVVSGRQIHHGVATPLARPY